jgi:hypothetical protein
MEENKGLNRLIDAIYNLHIFHADLTQEQKDKIKPIFFEEAYKLWDEIKEGKHEETITDGNSEEG